MKTCACCGEELPATLEFFYKEPRGGPGFRSKCKKCMRMQGKQWRENNKEAIKQKREEKKEWHSEYYKKWREDNKEYRSEYHRQWREDNKEHLTEYFRQYLKDNREKRYANNARREAIKKGAAVGKDFTRQDVLDKWGTDCHICGEPIDLDEWHQDHVIPLQPEEGEPGPHTLDNVKPSHPDCNMSKGNKIYETIQ